MEEGATGTCWAAVRRETSCTTGQRMRRDRMALRRIAVRDIPRRRACRDGPHAATFDDPVPRASAGIDV